MYLRGTAAMGRLFQGASVEWVADYCDTFVEMNETPYG